MDDANNQQRAPQPKYSYSFSSNQTQPRSSTNTSRYNGRRDRGGGNHMQKFNIRHKFKSGQRDYPTADAPSYRPYGYRGRGRVHSQRGPLPSQDHPMEDPWNVSIQNSPHLRRLSDYLSRSTISDAYTESRSPLDLTADPATLPNIEMRKLSSYFQAGPRGGAPSKMGPATVHKVKGANSRIKKPAKAVGLSWAGRTQIAQETIAHIPTILRSADAGCRLGYKVTQDNVGPLDSKMEECQGLSTRVMVVQGDTYDVAIALHNARDLMDHADPMPVCVLNFANAGTIGGGWREGAPAQEEQLCYRSTLSETLLPRFYPMGDEECIYSPHVIIFRENEKRGYSYMWPNKRDPLPQVSVISMAAQKRPPITKANKYKNATDRKLMKDKMRMILRTAGHNRHQRLVLGALGCGAFGHPGQEAADCWKEVLAEVEFQEFFDLIVFAIYDAGNKNNYEIFRATLHEDVETDYESAE